MATHSNRRSPMRCASLSPRTDPHRRKRPPRRAAKFREETPKREQRTAAPQQWAPGRLQQHENLQHIAGHMERFPEKGPPPGERVTRGRVECGNPSSRRGPDKGLFWLGRQQKFSFARHVSRKSAHVHPFSRQFESKLLPIVLIRTNCIVVPCCPSTVATRAAAAPCFSSFPTGFPRAMPAVTPAPQPIMDQAYSWPARSGDCGAAGGGCGCRLAVLPLRIMGAN